LRVVLVEDDASGEGAVTIADRAGFLKTKSTTGNETFAQPSLTRMS
jgi:hypothetical protein